MSFPDAASVTLRDSQLRRNLRKATTPIREKRAGVVGELPDWAELRAAGRAIKDAALVERLRARGFTLLDTQWVTPHLRQFGAIEIPRPEYLQRLDGSLQLDVKFV